MRLAERLKGYVDQPIAILCARYWYRGMLKEVGDDHVMLTHPRAVEVTGSAQSERPEREDPIPSDLYVRIDFIEIVCQPTWVYHGLSDKDRAEWDRKIKAKEKIEVPQPARQR